MSTPPRRPLRGARRARRAVREREHLAGTGDVEDLDIGEGDENDPAGCHAGIMLCLAAGRNAMDRTISARPARGGGDLSAAYPRPARSPKPRSIISAFSPIVPRDGSTPSCIAASYRSKNARTRNSFSWRSSQ